MDSGDKDPGNLRDIILSTAVPVVLTPYVFILLSLGMLSRPFETLSISLIKDYCEDIFIS